MQVWQLKLCCSSVDGLDWSSYQCRSTDEQHNLSCQGDQVSWVASRRRASVLTRCDIESRPKPSFCLQPNTFVIRAPCLHAHPMHKCTTACCQMGTSACLCASIAQLSSPPLQRLQLVAWRACQALLCPLLFLTRLPPPTHTPTPTHSPSPLVSLCDRRPPPHVHTPFPLSPLPTCCPPPLLPPHPTPPQAHPPAYASKKTRFHKGSVAGPPYYQ